MLTFIKKSISEEYLQAFQDVFGEWTFESNSPSTVYYAYENEILVGFMAGYSNSPASFYLQRTGFINTQQRSVRNLNRMREGLAEIHKVYPHVTSNVNADNVTMLKMALMVGFKIRGTRIAPDGTFWVEMIHKREG